MSGNAGDLVSQPGISGASSPSPSAQNTLVPPTVQIGTFYLEWNGDLLLTPNGSVLMATGWDEVRERIIRRFLTNSALPLPDGTTTPPDYVFDTQYGLGAGALIDQNPNASYRSGLNRRMREAVVADAAAAPGATPSISVQTSVTGTTIVQVGIQLISGQQGSFSIQFGGVPQS